MKKQWEIRMVNTTTYAETTIGKTDTRVDADYMMMRLVCPIHHFLYVHPVEIKEVSEWDCT